MEVVSNILPSYILDKPTPSQQDGVSHEIEKLHRVYGCELVVQGGTILKLPQVVMVTGQNILNRFFYRKSLKRFDVFSIAMGSLLLASKVEECFKTLREVLFAFHHIYARRKALQLKPMELGGQQYSAWKNELIMIERYILKELGFSLYNIMDHPHKYILYFIKVLNGSEELANAAWRFLNDSMRLDISLRFEAQTIACAAIFLAARKIAFALPEDAETGVWWEVFGASTQHLNTICEEIIGLYQYEKLTWLEPIAEVEYLSPENCAKFDSLLVDEVPETAPVSTASASDFGNIEPFANQMSASGVVEKQPQQQQSALDGTPVAGEADRSQTPTPILSSSASRTGLSGDRDRDSDGKEGVGKDSSVQQAGRKLERKWMSVLGDIDQLDAAPAPAPAVQSASAEARPSVQAERDSVKRGREYSKDRRPRERSFSRDAKGISGRRSGYTAGGERDNRRRDESRESRFGDSRHGHADSRDSRDCRGRGRDRDREELDRDARSGSRDRHRDTGHGRDRDRDRQVRRDRSRNRDGGEYSRRRDSNSERGRDSSHAGSSSKGYARESSSRDVDREHRRDDGRRKRSRSRSSR